MVKKRTQLDPSPLLVSQVIVMNHRRIVQVSLGIRIGIAVLTRTVFQPDEYFQSLEPAFRVVFGHGHLTWEWLSQNPIRSIIYPALNIPVYWLLKATGLAHTGWVGDWLLVGVSFSTFLPILTRKTRYYFPKSCMVYLEQPRTFGYVNWRGWRWEATMFRLWYVAEISTWSCLIYGQLFLSLTSFFHALSLSRSMSNSLETSLSTMAFAYYPWDVNSTSSPGVLDRCV